MRRRSFRVGVRVLAVVGLVLLEGCALGKIEETSNEQPRTPNRAAEPAPTTDPFTPASRSDASLDVDLVDMGLAEDASPFSDSATHVVSDAAIVEDSTVAPPVVVGNGPPVAASVADVKIANLRGELIHTRVFLPAGTTKTRHPAVIVLHGSGGLFLDPTSADRAAGRTCSNTMSSQFNRWAARLNARGFVAIFPDSFGSRGYCDEETDPRRDAVLPPVVGDENGKTRRLISRLYDLDASARFLCAHGRVRCNSLGVVGFSNGGSAIALGFHHKLGETLSTFAQSTRGKSIGVAMPTLVTPLPYFRVGVAYYPGCGFDGLMPSTLDEGRIEEFLYPRADTHILHGSEDALLEHCSREAVGTREIQADRYAQVKGLPDRYHVKVYAGAGHGFDGAGCEKAGADLTSPDIKACADGVSATMGLLNALDAP